MKLEIKKGNKLTANTLKLMRKTRLKEYGKDTIDFKKTELKNTFFFVKDNNKIVSFGMLKPITINYLGKKYNFFGIANIISIKKGKGYGKILIKSMLDYLKKTGKSGLGFCDGKISEFYRKAGLNTKKDFIKRFQYKDPKTGKITIDNDGDGLYYNGKDNFIKKILSNKSMVYMETLFW